MADAYSVSEAFIRSRRKAILPQLESRLNEAVDNVFRIGNLTLVSKIYGVKESEIRKTLKDRGISTQDIVAGHENSYQSSKGRKAELAFAEFRGSKIQRDVNHSDPHARWDFEDQDLGKVNVKSASCKIDSKGVVSYTFSCNSAEFADHFALIGYDEAYEHVKCMLVMPARLFVGKNTVTLKQHQFSDLTKLSYNLGVPYCEVLES